MDRSEELSARVVWLLASLAIGGISLIIFAIYWCTCRQRWIPGVVLGMPNSVQPNTVAAPFQNATGASYVGPQYVVVGSHTNQQGAPYPVAAANPHVGAQYPMAPSGASCTSTVYTSVTNQEPPPSYNQTYQERVEQHFNETKEIHS